MTPRIDHTGQRFGRLTVVRCEGALSARTPEAAWLCRCDCGGATIATGSNLRRGKTRSCGCLKRDVITGWHATRRAAIAADPAARLRLRVGRHPVPDLAGQRFGRLVAVAIAPQCGRRTAWTCRCDCGATPVVRAQSLRAGRTCSCGCLRRAHGAALGARRRAA